MTKYKFADYLKSELYNSGCDAESENVKFALANLSNSEMLTLKKMLEKAFFSNKEETEEPRTPGSKNDWY